MPCCACVFPDHQIQQKSELYLRIQIVVDDKTHRITTDLLKVICRRTTHDLRSPHCYPTHCLKGYCLVIRLNRDPGNPVFRTMNSREALQASSALRCPYREKR